MGLFQNKHGHKKLTEIEAAEIEEQFLDETFREELRNHGRWYFEKVIKANGILFKKELDATVEEAKNLLSQHIETRLDAAMEIVANDLKDHVTDQLDEQLSEYGKAVKAAQDLTLQSITHSSQVFQDQHRQLSEVLQKNIADHQRTLAEAFEDHRTQMQAIQAAQEAALRTITDSAASLVEQDRRLRESLEKGIAEKEAAMVEAFETNMAQVIETSLVQAIGETYDLKAQMPAIIKQLEANKQAILDDIRL